MPADTSNPGDSSRFTYRADIDGLRAIAVALVVLYHANLGIPGGYIGVDVFFVISGFLITSLLTRDIRAGAFTLGDFWERRARRILPALSATVLATLLAGILLFLPQDLDWLARSAAAQALMVSNFYFFRNTDYFGGDVGEMPLLHTWSLAVEEQFYLLFPLLLLACHRFIKPQRIPVVLAAILVASMWNSASSLNCHPAASFFLLPSRAWELLAGSCVALLPSRHGFPRRPGANFLALASLLAILLPAFFYKDDTPFPGFAAVPPVLGAAGLLYLRGTWIQYFLSWAPVVFIGLISYSLYLWHWPLLVFADYWRLGGEHSVFNSIGLVVLSVIVATASYKWIETPFRKKQVLAGRRGILRFAAATTVVVLGCSVFLIVGGGFPDRYPKEMKGIMTAHHDRIPFQNQTADDIDGDRLPRIGSEHAPDRFLLWGDSHAQTLLPAFEEFASDTNSAGYYATHAATAPLCDRFFHSEYGLNEGVIPLSDALIRFIERKRIPNTILAAYWGLYQRRDSASLEEGLRNTIRRLSATGTHVWILIDVPTHRAPVPKALAKNAIFGSDVSFVWCSRQEHREQNEVLYRLASQISDASFIDPVVTLFDVESGNFRVSEKGRPLYYDSQHLTKSGSKTMILPLLLDSLGQTQPAGQ